MTISYQALSILPIGSTVPIIFKVGANANFNLNAQVVTEMERNDEAVMSAYNLRLDGQTPTFQFSPSRESGDTTAFRMARLLTSESGSATYIWNRQVSRNTYAPVTTGFQGFGSLADDTGAIGSVIRNGRTIAITRAAYAAFNHATADQFAVDANAGIKVSDNLIGSEVSILLPYPVTNAAKLGAKAPNFAATITAVQNDRDGRRKIAQISMPLAAVNVQDSGQVANGDPAQISIVDLSGECILNWRYFSVQPAC